MIRRVSVCTVLFLVTVFNPRLSLAQQSTASVDQLNEAHAEYTNIFDPQVSLTINPRTRHLQIYWSNLNVERGDRVLITDVDPGVNQFYHVEVPRETVPTTTTNDLPTTTEAGLFTNLYSLDKFLGLGSDSTEAHTNEAAAAATIEPARVIWRFGTPARDAIFSMPIHEKSGWWKTTIPFNRDLFNQLTVNTGCYGYWVHMINSNGTVIARNCWRAQPRWMNEMRDSIKDVKMRHLFIPGTHDSGSHKSSLKENLLTKYAVTQDDDIRSQLMHGIRYLDLRVGHYRQAQHAFYIVHSVVKFQPLIEVLDAVKNFVDETNEIVIIDFQEFPVGFYPNETLIHQKLVQFIHDEMKEHLVQPLGTWDVTLGDIWEKKGNVIIGYDKPAVQFTYPDMLWKSVEHFWPNKGDINSLVRYLRSAREANSNNYRMRPSAEMAELTPQPIDVITDRYGGLRKMAQTTNKVISELYQTEFGLEANVVAVDFYMSSTIVETALKFNRLKKERPSSRKRDVMRWMPSWFKWN